MAHLEELKAGASVRGLAPSGLAKVVQIEWFGDQAVKVTFEDSAAQVRNRLVFRAEEPTLEVVEEGRPWSFDGDGALLRLVSEAYRIRLAHLFDPYLAIHTSRIEPLPHQITAVYGEMLPRQPLRFLLADDPGAGKTIMAGLFIKELLIRGDLERCLIVAPGSLVEQWQDELSIKFGLSFDILSRDQVEAARTGNPFGERALLIARLDMLSRSDDLKALLGAAREWDLVVCDEAHRMAASFFGGEVKYTKRYQLGQLLGSRCRHFLLMSATQAVRSWKAWASIVRDNEALNLDPFQKTQAESKTAELDKTIEARLFETWSWALVPLQPEANDPAIEWDAERVQGNDLAGGAHGEEARQQRGVLHPDRASSDQHGARSMVVARSETPLSSSAVGLVRDLSIPAQAAGCGGVAASDRECHRWLGQRHVCLCRTLRRKARPVCRPEGDRWRVRDHRQPERDREDRCRARATRCGPPGRGSQSQGSRRRCHGRQRRGGTAAGNPRARTTEGFAALCGKPVAGSRPPVPRHGPHRRRSPRPSLDTAAGKAVDHRRDYEIPEGVPEDTQRTVLENGVALKFKSQGFEAT
jgi:SNF2-related domain